MVIRSKAYLKDKFKTGDIITQENLYDLIDTLISQINDKTPDAEGNVRTDFHIIDPIAPDVLPSNYPRGTTEFYSLYKAEDYPDFIASNPSFEQLEDGNIAIRTFIEPEIGIAIQEVDNIKDGMFQAEFIRVGDLELDIWGPLIKANANPEIDVDALRSAIEVIIPGAGQGGVFLKPDGTTIVAEITYSGVIDF